MSVIPYQSCYRNKQPPSLIPYSFWYPGPLGHCLPSILNPLCSLHMLLSKNVQHLHNNVLRPVCLQRINSNVQRPFSESMHYKNKIL